MNEGVYQRKLIKKLQGLFPDCVVLKNNASEVQGIPDLIVLFEDKWGALEVKASPKAPEQPNQAYHIDLLNNMSFAAFINPDNEGEILGALQSTFGVKRQARISVSE